MWRVQQRGHARAPAISIFVLSSESVGLLGGKRGAAHRIWQGLVDNLLSDHVVMPSDPVAVEQEEFEMLLNLQRTALKEFDWPQNQPEG